MIKIFPTAESVVASFIGTFWPAFHHCLHANIVPQKYNEGCTTWTTHLRYISSRLQNLDIQEHWHFNPYLHLSTFYFCVYLYNTVWIQFGYFQCSALLMRLSVRPSAFSNKTNMMILQHRTTKDHELGQKLTLDKHHNYGFKISKHDSNRKQERRWCWLDAGCSEWRLLAGELLSMVLGSLCSCPSQTTLSLSSAPSTASHGRAINTLNTGYLYTTHRPAAAALFTVYFSDY